MAAKGYRTALIAVAVLVAAVPGLVAAGIYVRSRWFGPWADLRDQVERFEVPDGFRVVDRKEEGSERCFVSCDEPRITLVLVTELPDDEACRRLEAEVRRRVGEAHPWDPGRLTPPPDAACHWQGRLPRAAGADATLSAAVETGASLLGSFYRADGLHQPPRFRPTDRVAYLLFNSGLD